MKRYLPSFIGVASCLAVTMAASVTPSFAFAQSDSHVVAVNAAQDSDVRMAMMQRQMGHFSCGYNERRTHLERKNCGGHRS